MGIPGSRFMRFHRMVFLPPLIFLTLTCLYTSSTLSTKYHSVSRSTAHCFACEKSPASKPFQSLANFQTATYIKDVVLRHSVLNVEDSRGEASTEPVSRRDGNGVERDVGIVEADSRTMNRIREEEISRHPRPPKDEEPATRVSGRIIPASLALVEEKPAREEETFTDAQELAVDEEISPDEQNLENPSSQQDEQNLENPSSQQDEQNLENPSSQQDEQNLENPSSKQDAQNLENPSSKQDEQNLENLSSKQDEQNLENAVSEHLDEQKSDNAGFELSDEQELHNAGSKEVDSKGDHGVRDEEVDVEDNEHPENRHLTSNEGTVELLQESLPIPQIKKSKFEFDGISEEQRLAAIVVEDLIDTVMESGLPRRGDEDAVEDNLLRLRGGSLQGSRTEDDSCDGRRVYVYDLPSKFNADLVDHCDTLLEWFSFCDYFMNTGMGLNVSTDRLSDRGEQVLVPEGSWHLTHMYALEIIFHARLKHYPCLTTDVNEASLFFIPYYAGLDVIRWHFQTNVSNEKRDELSRDLMSWLETQEPWRRNGGVDHVLVLGKIGWDFRRADTARWGSSLLRLPSMHAPTKLLIERDPWHVNDVGVPHPTFFHPKDDDDIRTWLAHVEQSERRHLVSFAGMPRPNMLRNVRGHIIQQCLDHSDDCFLLKCEKTLCLRPDSTMDLFLHSHFCMQPPGDSPTRRSLFDSLIGGCIPVLFDPYTAYYQYPWHLPQNASSYSVFIPSAPVMEGKADIVAILESISPEERTTIRTRIIYEIIPGLLYSKPGTKHSDFMDAFDISMQALLNRVANLRAEHQLPL